MELPTPLVLPAAGDLVEVEAIRSEGKWRACTLEVRTPYRAEAPFPSPGGEYYRLHRPLAGHQGAELRATVLQRRARCLAAIRAFFDARGFFEVEPPRVVRCPGLEPHLVAVPAGAAADRYLITSPEYHMKRLLAAGCERIYYLGPCWRGEELGRHHLEEFCMLEWYQAFFTLEQLMEQTEALLRHVALTVTGSLTLPYQGTALALEAPFRRLTVAEAFRRHAGIELEGVTDGSELLRRAEAAGLGPLGSETSFDAVASRILVERVEPALAGNQPVFLHDFPAPLAALSRLRDDDPRVAERCELYAGGIELANAFGELTDPDVQRRRLEEDQRARRENGAAVYPIDERFLAALSEGLPPSAGIALGVDRLVMLLCDAPDVREVVPFGPDEI